MGERGREISDDNKRWDDRTDRMTFEVRNGNKTVRSVWRNSATLSESKRDGLAARDTGNNSEALDRAAGVVPPQPMLDAVIEGRS